MGDWYITIGQCGGHWIWRDRSYVCINGISYGNWMSNGEIMENIMENIEERAED